MYEVCFYGAAAQKDGGMSTSLGSFARFENNFSTMVYEGGQGCWSGPPRSIRVRHSSPLSPITPSHLHSHTSLFRRRVAGLTGLQATTPVPALPESQIWMSGFRCLCLCNLCLACWCITIYWQGFAGGTGMWQGRGAEWSE